MSTPPVTADVIDGPLELPPGHLLAERFEIEDRIGAGGMGTVYRARDVLSGELVAIKGLTQPAPDLLVRFKREYRALADVRHPNLVRLGDLFHAGGRVYFSMELLDGVPFDRWVRPPRGLRLRRAADSARNGFDEPRLRSALGQLADGLSALHAANLVHRDLKPSNVLVTPSGRVVILDLGLAARLADGRQASDVIAVGTVSHMAPEQAAGRALDARADWYAVGVLLFEALTGTLPFDGNALAILSAKLTEEPPDPVARAPGAPADLAALCRDLLAREPAARPSGAALARRLRVNTGARPQRRRAAGTTALVGRRAELDELARARSDARRGPVIQLVTGAWGLGKTELVRDVLRTAAQAGALVLESRCHERESLPFKAFDAIADQLARRLARLTDDEVDAILPRRPELLGALFPALDHVKLIGATASRGTRFEGLDPREQRRRAFAAFRELLTRIAERQELILFVDDLHRADADSVDLLAYVMRPDEGPAALFVATARPSETVDQIVAMGARGELVAVRSLVLGPLGDGPTRELARLALAGTAVSGADHASVLGNLVDESRGYPGLVLELARTSAGGPVRPSFDALIASRLAAVPPAARSLLDILAVADAPVPIQVLTAATRGEQAAVVAEIERLCDAGLAVTGGHRGTDLVELRHDRIGDSLRAGMHDETKRSAHGALAVALDRTERGDVERVLSHYLAAGETGPVLRLAATAAQHAADGLQHRRAVRLCNLALGHDPAPATAQQLHRIAASALAAVGQAAGAAEHFLELARLAAMLGDDRTACDARRRAGDQLLASGDISRGVELLDGVLRDLGVPVATTRWTATARLVWARARVRLRGTAAAPRSALSADERQRLDTLWSTAIALSTVDVVRGAECQARSVRLALDSGDPELAARALGFEAAYRATRGASTRPEVERLLADADRVATGDGIAWVRISRGIASLLLGDFAASVRASDHALDAVPWGEDGGAWGLRSARLYRVRSRWWAGRLAEYAPMVRSTIADARQHDDRYTLVQLLVGIGGYAWLMADDLPGYWRNVDEAARLWQAPTYQLQDHFHLVSVVNGHLYAGDGAAAWRPVLETWSRFQRSQQGRITFTFVDAWQLRGRAAVAAARATAATARDALHADATRCAEHLAGADLGFAPAYAEAIRAAIAVQRGQRDHAARLLDNSSAVFERHGMAGFAAAARWHGAKLRGGRDGERAAALIAGELRDQGVVDPPRFVAMLLPGITTAPASR